MAEKEKVAGEKAVRRVLTALVTNPGEELWDDLLALRTICFQLGLPELYAEIDGKMKLVMEGGK